MAVVLKGRRKGGSREVFQREMQQDTVEREQESREDFYGPTEHLGPGQRPRSFYPRVQICCGVSVSLTKVELPLARNLV